MARLKQRDRRPSYNLKVGDLVKVHPSCTAYVAYGHALIVAEAGPDQVLVLFSTSEVDLRLAAQNFVMGQSIHEGANSKITAVKKSVLIPVDHDDHLLKPVTIQDLTDSRFHGLLEDEDD